MSLIEPKIELWYDAQWNDVTTDVRTEAGGGGIVIEKSDRDPDAAQVTFDNTDGKYSPRNPLSPLYGKLGRNTPIRISVPAWGGNDQYRIVGYVVSWPPRWDPSGRVAWTPVDCAGIRHRLTQGQRPLQSPIWRNLLSRTPVGYWPLETGLGSALDAGKPARSTGDVTFEADDGLPGSAGVAVLGDAAAGLVMDARTHTATDSWSAVWYLRVDADPSSDVDVLWLTTSGTTARRWVISINAAGSVDIDVYDADGASLDNVTINVWNSFPEQLGKWIGFGLEVEPDGADVDWTLRYHIVGNATTFFTTGTQTIAGIDGGKVTGAEVRPSSVLSAAGARIAHVYLVDGVAPFFTYNFAGAADGYAEERAITRFARLAGEEGISFGWSGTSAIAQPMGVQPRATLLDLLQECADADGGHLMERRTTGALHMRAGSHLVTRALAPVEIPYTSILPALQPVEDDQGTRNDVTVTRPGGGSYRSARTTGPLNTSDPEDDPDGAGVYAESVELNLAYDSQLRGAADLRIALGTLDEPRYRSVRVEVSEDLAVIEPGWFVLLTGLPEFLPPDDSLQRVRGWTETIDVVQHVLDLDLTPGEPYRAGALDSTTRLDTAGAETTAAFVAGTDTSMTVQRSAGTTSFWTGDDQPFDVMASGVRLTVTAVSAASDPQTLTITATPVNGVIKTIPSGSPVTVAAPWRLAR